MTSAARLPGPSPDVPANPAMPESGPSGTMLTSSTSKRSVDASGMPLELTGANADDGGKSTLRLPPTRMPRTPSSQPAVLPTLKAYGLRPLVEANSAPVLSSVPV